MSIHSDSIDEIHSFDARYKNVIFRNNNLIVPYINLGVSNHPLNKENKLKFLDYSYMVFIDVYYLKVYLKKPYLVIDQGKPTVKYSFGGDYLDYDIMIYNDMEISCSEAYLQTLEFTNISDEMWMPFNTKEFPMNMNETIVEAFFNNSFMPKNIHELIR